MDADDTTLTSAVKYDTDSEHEGKTDNNAGTWIWIATTPRHYAINSMTPENLTGRAGLRTAASYYLLFWF